MQTSVERIPIAVVSYLNSKPYLHGLAQEPAVRKFAPVYATPAECARLVLSGEVELGLIPSGALPDLQEYSIMPGFCLGSVGPVKTVCLFSRTPLPAVRRILLDQNSRSSVALLRILLRRHWKIEPELVAGGSQPWVGISDDTAALVIGDQAISLLSAYPHVYDLALEWRCFSGLPFVFAVWASRRPLTPDTVAILQQAFRYGVEHIPEVCALEPWGSAIGFDLIEYLTRCISYELTPEMQRGLDYFLKLLHEE